MDLKIDPRNPHELPTEFRAHASAALDIGPGCDERPTLIGASPPNQEVFCPLRAPVQRHALRYRLSLADGGDHAVVSGPDILRGVVYAGAGNDDVEADHVYGGAGSDGIEGTRVYGGSGADELSGTWDQPVPNILRGGRHADALYGPGWMYGGTGNDYLEDNPGASHSGPDMLVGGPGSDHVELTGPGRTVVRVRGGGTDFVSCPLRRPRPTVRIFVDRSDRIGPRCSRARMLFKERPRAR